MSITQPKCAPSKFHEKKKTGYCISHKTLNELLEQFNDDNKPINGSKKDKIEYLLMKAKCNNEHCLITASFAKNNNELINNTYRPIGPANSTDWLGTDDINNILRQYENVFDNFKYIGTVPMDFYDLNVPFYPKFSSIDYNSHTIYAMVINLDYHYQSGSHWVALYIDKDKNSIYYFDSNGNYPPEEITNYINILDNILGNYKFYYNELKHQYSNTECGIYCITIIIAMLYGRQFEKLCSKRIADNLMKAFRKEFFNHK
jgi:hypothetical protein